MTQPLALTAELRQAIDQAGGAPLLLIDQASGERFVVLRADSLGDSDDFRAADAYPAQDSALSATWDDPELDVYNADAAAEDP